MGDVLQLLVPPLIAVAAWQLARTYSEAARKAARVMSVVAFAGLAAIALSGVLHANESAAVVHRWSGHGLFMVLWLFVPFAFGVAIERHFPRRPVVVFAQALALLLLLAGAMLASMTGYLRANDVGRVSEETNSRFVVLHLIGLPAIIALLVAAWFWCFRPRSSLPT